MQLRTLESLSTIDFASERELEETHVCLICFVYPTLPGLQCIVTIRSAKHPSHGTRRYLACKLSTHAREARPSARLLQPTIGLHHSSCSAD